MRIGDRTIFKGTVKKAFCEKPTFKVYSVTVDEILNGTIIKHPIYNNVTIKGDFQELNLDGQYEIEVEYRGENQYGHEYQAIRVSVPRPTTPQQVRNFLSEFISVKRAEELVRVYPNIIDMILKGETVDVSKLSGIGEKSIESIKKKIMDNIGVLDLHKEFGKFGLTFSTLRKMLTRYKTVDNAIYQINRNPYDALTQINGIGFITADEIALKINPNFINSIERMVGCIDFYLSENENNGNTYMDVNMLHSECMTHVKESIAYFTMALQDESLFYDAEGKRVARSFIRKREERIAHDLIEMEKDIDVWDIDTSKYKVVNGFELTEEQMGTLKSVCEHRVTCLIGGGGMGKSASIQGLVSMLEDNGKSYKLITPTAKSADVLADFTQRDAKTAHRTLGYNGSGFESGEDNKMDADVIVFDEFSMSDVWLFHALILATRLKETRFVLVGDSWQLPSIGAGNLLYDISTSGVINVIELTKVFRYADGGLMKIVTDVRNSIKFLDNGFRGSKVFGANQDFCYVEIDQDFMVEKALSFYQKLLDNGNSVEDILIVTSKNVSRFGTVEINRQVQRMLQKDQDNESIVINDNFTLYLGDKVKQKVNNYDIQMVTYSEDPFGDLIEDVEDSKSTGEVYNGQTGIVTYIDNVKKLIHVRIKGIEYIYKKDSIMEQLDLGYALTVYSAQGMSINYVISIMPKADTFMLNSNNIYTALTRARKRCYLLGNIYTINNAIKKKANLTRNTFTKELLIQYKEEGVR